MRHSIEVGEIIQSSSCGDFEVISGKLNGKYQIRFIETGYEVWARPTEVRNGKIKDKSYLNKYKDGSSFETLNHGPFVVVKYTNAANILVEFTETGYRTNTCVSYIESGKIGDRLRPSTCGVGFIGVGEYDNKTHKKLYCRWNGMLRRGYSVEHKNGCYSDVTVCDEWNNFQVFAKWATKQIGYDLNGWELDKDILVRGNKVYCPEACCFLPKRINSLLIKSGEYKSNGMLAGVRQHKITGRYIASYRGINSERYSFETTDLQTAEAWYRHGKQSVVKAVANMYKNEICVEAYNALMVWEVSCENPHL